MTPMKPPQFHSRRRTQHGVTLIEALVALVVMSFGMVALVGLLSNLRYSADLGKQRSEAMRLAQQELETLRTFSSLNNSQTQTPGVTDYDTNIATLVEPETIRLVNGNATFLLDRQVTPLVQGSAEPRGKTLRVTVSWVDRANTPQRLVLDSVISRTDPVFSVALGVTPPTEGIRQPDKRHPVVPPGAKDLGNGSSAFRPSSSGATVWVLNNVTGVVTGKCDVDAETLLDASSVESCKNNTTGYLVSGVIRFSKLSRPDPSAPEANALPYPLSVYLDLKPSQLKNSAGTALLPGGDDYPTPNHHCFSDAPQAMTADQKLVNYYCIVFPNSQRNWWGQVLLTGLDIGTGASQYKVCRYSADSNGNSKIDNEEHPESYSTVSYSLTRQNFLVIPGKAADSCPKLPPDADVGRFLDYSTYQIQP
jgi:type II secretory pathway pseudopilin PulG